MGRPCQYNGGVACRERERERERERRCGGGGTSGELEWGVAVAFFLILTNKEQGVN